MATETSKIGSATIDNQTKCTYMYDANLNHYITEIEHELEDSINTLGISMDNDSLKHFVQQAKGFIEETKPSNPRCDSERKMHIGFTMYLMYNIPKGKAVYTIYQHNYAGS